jgi:hypothetical protein
MLRHELPPKRQSPNNMASSASGKRRSAAKPPAPSEPEEQELAGALPIPKARKALIGRLYRAISLKLEHMETRMASGDPRSAQDEERESRALSTLINNFEKVTEAVAELDKDGSGRRRAGAGADAERMRREIAERLERLGSGGAPKRGSHKPRP